MKLHQIAQVPMALNSNGITAWVQSNIVPLLLLVVGLGILTRSRKGNLSEVMTTSMIAIIGIIFIVGAAGFIAFGEQMSGIVFGG